MSKPSRHQVGGDWGKTPTEGKTRPVAPDPEPVAKITVRALTTTTINVQAEPSANYAPGKT